MLEELRRNVRYAARSLARNPLFAVVAVLSIAIGVGATTAIVTLANTLLLRTPPGIGHPEQVVTLARTQEGNGFDNMSYPNFLDYRSAKSFSGLAAIRMDPEAVSLAGPSGGEPIEASVVSGNFFDVLQARPALGRFFIPDEDRAPWASPVAVLSYKLWRDRFARDRGIIGTPIVLNGRSYTVVGVAAEHFQGPFVFSPDVWVPVMAAPILARSSGLLDSRQAVWMIAIGRLAQNATIGSAQAELGAIAARLERDYPEANRGKGAVVLPATFFPGDTRKMVGGFIALLFAVAGLVLIIGSTNVAGMLLARASARQREIAVRLAIGASRRQLVAQLVTESVLLFMVAGAVGLLLAKWLVAALMALVPRLPVQLAFDPSIDWLVLGFALVTSLITGLVAGIVPAMQSTAPALVPALKSDAGGTGRRQRLRGALLISQIAFSMLLLIVAGLFARTLIRAQSIDTGFDPKDVHIARMDFSLANYDATRGRQFVATLLDRVSSVPQVKSAAMTAMLPLDGGGLGLGRIEVDGRTGDPNRGWREDWNVITSRYFETLGMRIVRGRDFNADDRAGAQRVAILNETFAQTLWPGQDAIGKTFRNDSQTVTVVGIARNAKYRTLGESPRNFVYVPLSQRFFERTSLIVKAEPRAAVAGTIRKIVAQLDPALPILDQRTMTEQTATSLFPQRVALWVAGSLGGVALLLALLGIYGVIAYNVTQRTREIGVRVALGADRRNVLALVLKQGVVLAGIGVAVGAIAAAAVTRALSSLLYGVPPTDVVAFAGAAVLLALAALAASWVPAMRAAAVDPMIALRSD